MSLMEKVWYYAAPVIGGVLFVVLLLSLQILLSILCAVWL